MAQLVKNPSAMWEIQFQSLGWEDSLEKGKATDSSVLAWRITWTIQSMASQRVGHDWVTFTFTFYWFSTGACSKVEEVQIFCWKFLWQKCIKLGQCFFFIYLNKYTFCLFWLLSIWWITVTEFSVLIKLTVLALNLNLPW